MSTKVSLNYGKQHHLYQEVYDEKHVYLKVYGYDFEVSKDNAMIQIPIELWEKLVAEWPESKKRWIEDNSHEDFSDISWLEFGSNTTSTDETTIFERKNEPKS